MATLRSRTGLVIGILLAALLLSSSLSYAATGYGVSNTFKIDNKNAIQVTATNNWDGTVTVTWPDQGGVELIRQEVDNASNIIGWSRIGTIYLDKYLLSEFKKKYIYILKDLSGKELGRSSVVMPDIVVVLVRGYSPHVWKAVNDNYWKIDGDNGVVDVKQWFEKNNITCWEPLQGYIDGQGLSGWKSINQNCLELTNYINAQRTGIYADAKINLIGHSMGGLISRQYAHDKDNIVNNVFCIQTPHTGSPLAGLAGFWDVAQSDIYKQSLGVTLYNKATDNLTFEFLTEKFNYNLPKSIKLYLFYSQNWERLQNSIFYKSSNVVINNYRQYSIDETEQSDGVVPYLSGQGKYYNKKTKYCPTIGKFYCSYSPLSGPYYTTVEWDAYPTSIFGYNAIASSMDNNFDHNTGYRHVDTLKKILEWLGYSQPVSSADIIMQASDAQSDTDTIPLHYIFGVRGVLDNTSPQSHTVMVSNCSTACFRVITGDMDYVFTLEDPLGKVYAPDNVADDPNVTCEIDGEITFYEINNPAAGEWILRLTSTAMPPYSVHYGLTVFEDANITLNSYISEDWANVNSEIRIVAELNAGNMPIPDAAILAQVILPDLNTSTVLLYDDGLHGDRQAGDGIYSNVFTDTALTGNYQVYMNAIGRISDYDYERSINFTFSISEQTIIISGNISDQGVDDNQNGRYDVLRFKIPVAVQTAKDYRMTAVLMDSASSQISLVNTGLLSLAADANSIIVDISAEELVKHGVNGPYTLMDIKISDGQTGLAVAGGSDYATSAYNLSQFELLDSDKDGLPDTLEQIIGTLIDDPDTDNDGATDYQEVAYDGAPTSYNLLTDSDPLNADTDEDGMTDGYEIRYGLNPIYDDTEDDLDGDGIKNTQEYILYHTRPDKIDTDDDGRNDKWEIEHSTDPLVYESYVKQIGDIDFDAKVGISDINIMATQWLNVPSGPSADIAPEPLDNYVDLEDFALLALHWMEEL